MHDLVIEYDLNSHWYSEVNNYLKKGDVNRVAIFKIEVNFYKVKKTNVFLSLSIEVFTKKDFYENISAGVHIQKHNETILSEESSLEIYSPTPSGSN